MSQPQKTVLGPDATNRELLADLIAEVPSRWKTNFKRVVALLLVASLLEPRVGLNIGLLIGTSIVYLVLMFAVSQGAFSYKSWRRRRSRP